jgi:ferredoxin
VPAHLVFFDRGRLIEENRVFFDRTAHRRPVVPEADAVLAHFDDADANRRFLAHLANEPTAAPHIGPAARYLWAERFFPLKAQRLGPNLLAAEVLLAPEKLARFVTRARKLAARFGVELSVEAIFSRPRGRPICTVIAAYPADRRQPVAYGLRLLLVQLLIRLGLRLGGKPYGVGIWNAALITAHFDATRLDHLRRRKQELDTKGLLNPGKFFAVRSRFWNLPGLLFAPRVFHVLLAVAAWFSLPLGWLARLAAKKPAHRWMVPPVAENDGAPLLAQTSQRCTHCGACLSVCPAYALTGDELVTARAKLQLADVLLRDGVVEAAEAFNPFQCLRCGLCEEVCQTRLPLRDCYDRLEMLVDRRFGAAPEPLVREFIARVDAERRWIERTFGLDLADWSPAGLTPVLPRAHRAGGQR